MLFEESVSDFREIVGGLINCDLILLAGRGEFSELNLIAVDNVVNLNIFKVEFFMSFSQCFLEYVGVQE